MSGRALLFIVMFLSIFTSQISSGAEEFSLDRILNEDADLSLEIENELQEFYKERDQDLANFRDERDAEFAEFLKEQWADYAEFSGLIRDKQPKPVVFPKAFDEPRDLPPSPGKEDKPVILDPPQQSPLADIPPSVKPIPPIHVPVDVPPPDLLPDDKIKPPIKPRLTGGLQGEIDYYGQQMFFNFDPKLAGNLTHLNNEGISAFWSKVSKIDYQTVTGQLGQIRNQFALNDWGFYQLLQKVSSVISDNQNERVLLSWFLLIKSGFQANIGYSDDSVFLMVPSENTIYNVPFYNIDGNRYYNFTFIETGNRSGKIKTYNHQYPGADNKIHFGLLNNPQLPSLVKKRLLKFSYRGKTHSVPIKMNLNVIDFYRTYPSTDMQIFFNAPVDNNVAISLLEGLHPVISGKNEAEAANILLRFVQTAFEYKTDAIQFGGEKYMFAAETLFYPYSDCEDRSILFSYLVRKLLKLEVVGLIYPGHAATAVKFNQPLSGDLVEINGVRYIVCDPTYTNADIGKAMPKFMNSKPKVIAVN